MTSLSILRSVVCGLAVMASLAGQAAAQAPPPVDQRCVAPLLTVMGVVKLSERLSQIEKVCVLTAAAEQSSPPECAQPGFGTSFEYKFAELGMTEAKLAFRALSTLAADGIACPLGLAEQLPPNPFPNRPMCDGKPCPR